ncbi:uncharacterized protein LACBIDRAFT_315669 [Laccaria bicolor S238N-H82]|uniref:Predicted protein n=1 Tax=Laccaria bicolor (strain S238N-H82 / ATCC MYA-4686) TaxID=486041 RepID=B0D2W3_LACBS|nr:uncharacterized protein LACBIDRAFT_315669 [Laccaria bicolor S238N-H82]EDR11163.1 predicted protein [Laccaria bicolor S238N-H82]|eukprot:XP_001878464.1 predicted protein [Laccaria bicolor S238N-H82]
MVDANGVVERRQSSRSYRFRSLHVRPSVKPPAPRSPFRRLCVKAPERQSTRSSFFLCHHASSFPNPSFHHLYGYDETKQHPTARPFHQAVFMSILHGAL